MKTERNSDDLWNQRSLSTFQTFSRVGPDNVKSNHSSNTLPNYHHRLRDHEGLTSFSSNGHGHHTNGNGFSPHSLSSGSPSSVSSSSNGSPKQEMNGSISPSFSPYKTTVTISNSNASSSISGSSTLGRPNKAKPVPTPMLNGNAATHLRSRSMDNSHTNGGMGMTLLVAPGPKSGPMPVIQGHQHQNSSLSFSSMDSDFMVAPYIPTAADEKVLTVRCNMKERDRRFGFSVIGGRDEGFPPCIDEIIPGSPADKADLEVGDEILEVNGRSLEDATHTEVIAHIHQCIRSRTICLRVKRRSGNKLALDLASQSNVQDAFVIAVEQQARERLEKLSALKRIKPVDMTKLSHQLSEVPSGGGDTSELNGLIEAATGSPIYVTSASELSSSQSALHRTASVVSGSGGGGGGGEEQRSPLRSLDTNTNTTVQVGVQNHYPEGGGEGEEDQETTSSSRSHQVKRALPNGQYPENKKQPSSSSRGSIDSGKTSASRENLGGSRESLEVEGAKSSSSSTTVRGRGSKLNSGSRESIPDAQSQQYANMINMVEWDSGPHREMAVDVPDSFIPRNKTPPRYPPTKSSTLTNSNNNNKPALVKTASGGSAVVVSDGVGVRGQNGTAGKPLPPPRDSVATNNNNQVPYVHPRTTVSPTKSQPLPTTPSRDEAERIRKYQEELKKRRELEEKYAKEQEFLRTSLRGSKKLQALESRDEESPPLVTGFVNDAYDVDEDRIPYTPQLYDTTLQKPLGLTDLVASLQRVQQTLKKNGLHLDETVSAVGSLMQSQEFQQILAVHNKVQDVWCFNAPPTPVSAHGTQLVQECLGSLFNCSVPEAAELVEILSRVDLEGILYAHDKIAERERLLMTNDSPLAAGESVDVDTVVPVVQPLPPVPQPQPSANTSILAKPSTIRPPYSFPEPQPQHDDRIKVVRIEKTQDPLGATVRNEGDAVVIGRIVKGGAAERSGLLHEGDEVLEVNGIEMRAKSVNEVCDILSRLTGTLTFLIVPTPSPPTIQQRRDVLIHVRAHYDYDPEDDIYLPCRELGIGFSKGDVLHIINQDDPNWWQAHREGEEDHTLAGLIPSKSFQEQREALKQQLLGETETREKSKRGTLLCAKTQKKKKKKIPYSSAFNDDFDAEEIPTYEEVSLYYPRTSYKRPVVLIGPPNIGRHELRQRLMQESERFAAAVPHTSRPKKEGEIDGQDYHFITRAQFESDILARRFVEHGEFEKAYYGTSLDAIRQVVNLGKICVLNLHPQSLKMLRISDLKPYIVFVAPPPLERLKQMRIAREEAYKEEELIDIIEKAREMDEKYGHFFDLVIINNDIDRTYHELLQRINYTEREPQWVPAFWVKQ